MYEESALCINTPLTGKGVHGYNLLKIQKHAENEIWVFPVWILLSRAAEGLAR
jgi:hypothetical protein